LQGREKGKAEGIEKAKTKDGKSVITYVARVKESEGKKTEIKIGESGKFIQIQGD
jgi:hypothetical protein